MAEIDTRRQGQKKRKMLRQRSILDKEHFLWSSPALQMQRPLKEFYKRKYYDQKRISVQTRQLTFFKNNRTQKKKTRHRKSKNGLNEYIHILIHINPRHGATAAHTFNLVLLMTYIVADCHTRQCKCKAELEQRS